MVPLPFLSGDINPLTPHLSSPTVNSDMPPTFQRSQSDTAILTQSPGSRRVAMLNMFRPYRQKVTRADSPTSPKSPHPLEPSLQPLSPEDLRARLTLEISPNVSSVHLATPALAISPTSDLDGSFAHQKEDKDVLPIHVEDIDEDEAVSQIVIVPRIPVRPRLPRHTQSEFIMNRNGPVDSRAKVYL